METATLFRLVRRPRSDQVVTYIVLSRAFLRSYPLYYGTVTIQVLPKALKRTSGAYTAIFVFWTSVGRTARKKGTTLSGNFLFHGTLSSNPGWAPYSDVFRSFSQKLIRGFPHQYTLKARSLFIVLECKTKNVFKLLQLQRSHFRLPWFAQNSQIRILLDTLNSLSSLLSAVVGIAFFSSLLRALLANYTKSTSQLECRDGPRGLSDQRNI